MVGCGCDVGLENDVAVTALSRRVDRVEGVSSCGVEGVSWCGVEGVSSCGTGSVITTEQHFMFCRLQNECHLLQG